MSDTRTIRDPFLGKDVEISNKLTDRLRGKYADGPTMPNGEPEFGWRQFDTQPVQHEAAAEIDRLTSLFERQNAALKPFVEAFKQAEAENSPYHNVTVGSAADRLFYQDFERAAAAFSSDHSA